MNIDFIIGSLSFYSFLFFILLINLLIKSIYMLIETRRITDLRAAPYNPRQSTKEQEQHLSESLKKFGCVEPVIVNNHEGRENIIIGGHFRVRELKKIGQKEVDCVIVDLDEEDEKELNIRLNANTGEWDVDLLANNFDIDELNNWGLEVPEFPKTEEEIAEEIEEGEIPEKPDPIAKKGDIWQLGNHRLMCGDSTNENDVFLLMNNEKADLLFTDPPYGMKKEKQGIINDNLNYKNLLEFNKKWIKSSFDYLTDIGSWYCWGIDEPLMDIYSNILKPLIQENKITFRNLITWDKGNGQGQMSENFRMYPIADEKCLFVMAGVQGFNTNADNYFEKWEPIRNYLLESRLAMGWDVPTMKRIVGHSDLRRDHWTSKSQFSFPTREVYEKLQQEAKRQRQEKNTNNDAFKKDYDELKKDYDELKKDYDELKKDYYSTRAYFDNMHDNMNNVWHFERTNKTEREEAQGHCTPKPIKLCCRAIKTSSKENNVVLDLFGGSGSTLIACEQLNRRCYMMELDEHYCNVIIARWENLTGQKAIKIN